eukprot:TRINITY_DN2771_c1_g2_i1.p1 TRINITY_DN2771_c1_g2~~TRINITY_DN2771_c1_g2_i1.p1  ORF type:complete len:393 (+),score=55.63 TRINITY_DN2771_c1_g2_i1:77-1180(+)
MQQITAKENEGYIFSRTLDNKAIVLPIGIALAYSILERCLGWDELHEVPLWVYLMAVVACDVGHVSCSFLMAHQASCSGHGRVYKMLIPVVCLILLVLCLSHDSIAWIGIGYATLAHYVQQQYFFLTVAAGRAKRQPTTFENITLAVGSAAPILIWHMDTERGFDWFFRDDPLLVQIPEELLPLVLIIYCGVGLIYTAKSIVKRETTTAVSKIIATTWLSWGVGILYPSKTASMLFLTAPHAIMSFFSTFFTVRNKWAVAGVQARSDLEAFSRCLVTSPVYYLLFLLLLALCEECLWEALVWREWSTSLFQHYESSSDLISVYTALLLTPQTLHILYEFLLWDERTNPGVCEAVGVQHIASRQVMFA